METANMVMEATPEAISDVLLPVMPACANRAGAYYPKKKKK
jgi:hypothetical protein